MGFLFPSCFLSFFLFFFFGSVCGRVFFCLSVNQSCYETTHHVIEHKTCFCFCKNWASLDWVCVCVCVCVRIPQQYVRSIKFFAAMVPHSRNCGKRTRTSPGAAHCKKKKKSLMLFKKKKNKGSRLLLRSSCHSSKEKKKRTLLLLPGCVTPIFSCLVDKREKKKGLLRGASLTHSLFLPILSSFFLWFGVFFFVVACLFQWPLRTPFNHRSSHSFFFFPPSPSAKQTIASSPFFISYDYFL